LKATEKNFQEKLKDAIKKQKNVAECQLQASECTALVLEKQSFVACEKRRLLKQALNVKMDAIIEMSARMSIAATFGKHLADQIPQGQLSPGQGLPAYTGKETYT
jgi:Eisosome component PIL1